MMFIDASALCAMLTDEAEAAAFALRIKGAPQRATSPLAVWEAAINVARILRLSHDDAYGFVQTLLTEASISLVPITAEMTPIAIAAHRDFGKGRHPAALNFGDCFAYAAARHQRLPLMFKGEDFIRTDIERA
jgi:ribonuclease VapC